MLASPALATGQEAAPPSRTRLDTQIRVSPPAQPAAPAAPQRARPRDPRDRAFMDGGVVGRPGTSGFQGFGAPAPATPLAELAPRPDINMEYRAPARDPEVATITPTLINPQLPGRSAASDGSVTRSEQRFLQQPAAGARFSVPMSW
ncbi:hypothetical protein [Roseococcus sp. YIM B11640]|uniref:hypothetical protein n=1 Tax=Roseococcus sp. YIM B11640 TaxID=3133973 RepID=UPI003C7AB838